MACDSKGNELKVGDKVLFFDNSYVLKRCKIAGTSHPYWNNGVDTNLVAKEEVRIVEIELKVPAMHEWRPEIKKDEGSKVFLNIMVEDKSGDLWLAPSLLCDKLVPVRYFKLTWRDGSIESVHGSDLADALRRNGYVFPSKILELDSCNEMKGE